MTFGVGKLKFENGIEHCDVRTDGHGLYVINDPYAVAGALNA